MLELVETTEFECTLEHSRLSAATAATVEDANVDCRAIVRCACDVPRALRPRLKTSKIENAKIGSTGEIITANTAQQRSFNAPDEFDPMLREAECAVATDQVLDVREPRPGRGANRPDEVDELE